MVYGGGEKGEKCDIFKVIAEQGVHWPPHIQIYAEHIQ